MNEIINAETGEIETSDKLELIALPPSAKMTRVSLVIPDNTTFEEWEEIGKQLNHIERATQWAIGDWWNFGERHYGERYAQAIQAGETPETWMHYAWVARKFETYRCRQVLSFSYYQEVSGARIPFLQAMKMLERAKTERWSVMNLRNQVAEEYPREKPRLETAKFFSWFHEVDIEATLEGLAAIRRGVNKLIHDVVHEQRDPEVAKTILDSVWKLMRDISHDIEEVLGENNE